MVVKVTLCYIFVTKSRADNYNVTKSIISHVCEQSETSVRLSVSVPAPSRGRARTHTHSPAARPGHRPASPPLSPSLLSPFPPFFRSNSPLTPGSPLEARSTRTGARGGGLTTGLATFSSDGLSRSCRDSPPQQPAAGLNFPQPGLTGRWRQPGEKLSSRRRCCRYSREQLRLVYAGTFLWGSSAPTQVPPPPPSLPGCPGTDRPAPGPEPREAAAPRAFVYLFDFTEGGHGERVSGASCGFHETHGFLQSCTGESSPVTGSNQSGAHIVINAVIMTEVLLLHFSTFMCY